MYIVKFHFLVGTEGSSVTLTSSANYYMLYTKTIYIKYYDNDGSALSTSVSNTSGTAYTNYNLSSSIAGTAPKITTTKPTKSGYDFNGWTKTKNSSTVDYSSTSGGTSVSNLTSDLTLYAVWKSASTPVDPSSSQAAGKKITASSPAGVSEWLPFYKDSEGINYVISYDYVPYNATYMSSSNTKLAQGSSSCHIYWSAVPSTSYSEVSSFWRKSQANAKTNNNAKCAASLLNTSWWSSYVITTYGDQAIGSPSLEMYEDAYNARYGAGTLSYSQGTYGINYSGTPGTSDRAFCITETSRCYGLWLASPYGSGATTSLPIVYYNGNFTNTRYRDSNYGYGLRPVVRLKSGVKILETSSTTAELSY